MTKPHEQSGACKFSMEPAKSVYRMTAAFPAEARYGLTQQDSPPLKKGGRGDLSWPEYGNPPQSPFSKGGSEALETRMHLAAMPGFTTADHAAFDFSDRTNQHNKWNTA